MSIYEERRKRLFDELEDNSLFFAFAGRAPYSTGDELYPYVVNRNFYYLTGLDSIPNAVLVMRKAMGTLTADLFIERFDPVMAKWVGPKMLPEEATKISGIDRVSYIDELNSTVGGLIRVANRSDAICYFDLEKQEYDQVTEDYKYAEFLKELYPNIVVKNAFNLLAELRAVKDETEIEAMRKAIATTKRGLERVMKTISDKEYEYQVEAEFNHSLLDEGTREFAFTTIAASGKNATTLHYSANNCRIPEGSLMLFDLGAANNHYSSDISRTYPVNGKFTERQKAIYEAVLACNEYIIENVKPGLTLQKLNAMSYEFLTKKCEELGLMGEGKTIRDYYFHSIGHMLGLDTHDVTVSGYVLREGNVITVEPGLYIEDEEIGVRIEDDVLVTKDGCEVLSKDIIKSVEDIEKFMKK